MVDDSRIRSEVPIFGLVACLVACLPLEPAGEGAAAAEEQPGPPPQVPPTPEGPPGPPPGEQTGPLPRGPRPAGEPCSAGEAAATPPGERTGPLPRGPRPAGEPCPAGEAASTAQRGSRLRSVSASHAAAHMLVALLPFIQSVLRHRGVPARDTPDLAQDLVIKLLPKVACFAPGELQAPYDRCRRYLHVVATRYAWGYLRRAARRGEHLDGEPDWPEPEGGEGPAPPPSPEALLLQHEAAARLTAELDLDWLSRATSPACWRAFHAYHVTGTPIAEIAEAEVAPVATVYNRIRIARRDLRAAILRRRAADHRQ